jgi:hypothetical protein
MNIEYIFILFPITEQETPINKKEKKERRKKKKDFLPFFPSAKFVK